MAMQTLKIFSAPFLQMVKNNLCIYIANPSLFFFPPLDIHREEQEIATDRVTTKPTKLYKNHRLQRRIYSTLRSYGLVTKTKNQSFNIC